MSCVVTFDLDDTLYLERDFVRSGFAAVGAWLATERGVRGFEACAWRLFEAGRRGDIFDRVLPRLGVAPERALIRRAGPGVPGASADDPARAGGRRSARTA